MLFDLSVMSGFAEWMYLARECNAHGSVSFVFCCVLFCVLLLLLLAVSLAVLEFENGSQEEELLLFSMSQHGNFWMVSVACVVLRAVRLICWMPD